MSVSGKAGKWHLVLQFSVREGFCSHSLSCRFSLHKQIVFTFLFIFLDEEVCEYRVANICPVCPSMDYVSGSAENLHSVC